jgi:abequosyltransferase
VDNVRPLDRGDDILLSICIPTYNRAEYLKKTLDSIVNQEGFAEHCEIVISDNCSPDNTAEVVDTFMAQYKNIRYYRNDTNVGELNFVRVMDLARGKYIKLNGDKIGFCETGLTRLIGYLQQIDVAVVFLINCQKDLKEKGMISCTTFDEFVQKVSYWSTWMSGIILRKSDYQTLEGKERAIGSFLIQTDIMFRIIGSSQSTQIINELLLFEQPIENKGGYNLFEVFVNNYLSLYDYYLKTGLLSQKTYKNEKIYLLYHFVFPWYTMIVLRKKFQFEVTRANKIIIHHYSSFPQLFVYPFYLLRKSFGHLISMNKK